LLAGSFLVKTKTGEDFTAKPVLGFKELLPTPALYPINQNASEPPLLSAKSMLIVDVDSAAVLYQKSPDFRLLPASTTKIATALVALESYRLDEVLTVGTQKIEGNIIHLLPGEKITAENLLYGLLVGSGNDAAQTLAENFPGGMANFVSAMNRKAWEIKLSGTHFANPMGLDEENHYSTARDLAQLALIAIKNPSFAKIVSTSEFIATDISGTIVHKLKNTNELVGKADGVKGVKTGWTQNAGGCLVSLIEKSGRRIVIVVLGSEDRFGETEKLVDWIFVNFVWKIIAPPSYL